jgi:hypothetical protein
MSGLLTAGELTAMQTEAERLLTDSCTVRRPGSPVSDGAGGWTEGAATDYGPYDCSRRMPQQGAEMLVAGQLNLTKPWIILLPAGTDVRGDDQIVIGSAAYEVAGVLEGGTREILRRALVREVE